MGDVDRAMVPDSAAQAPSAPIIAPMHEADAVIIGAGAAGLHCAAIAGQRGIRVLLIDHASAVAEKIRISGGGRCNFTNREATPAHFLSANPDFCRSALARYTPRHFIELVDRHAIAWHEKHKGQLFCDDSSQQIIDMLLAECARGHVQRWQPCTVAAVRHGEQRLRARHRSRQHRRGAGGGGHRWPVDPQDRRQRLRLSAGAPVRPPDRRDPAGAGAADLRCRVVGAVRRAGRAVARRHGGRRWQRQVRVSRRPVVHAPRPERPGHPAGLEPLARRRRVAHRPGAGARPARTN